MQIYAIITKTGAIFNRNRKFGNRIMTNVIYVRAECHGLIPGFKVLCHKPLILGLIPGLIPDLATLCAGAWGRECYTHKVAQFRRNEGNLHGIL